MLFNWAGQVEPTEPITYPPPSKSLILQNQNMFEDFHESTNLS